MKVFLIVAISTIASVARAELKAKAAELRRWEGNNACTGEYSVLSTDKMDECTSYLIPAPASIWVEQKNDTAYSSYHCQGVTNCGQASREFLGDFIVGTCESFGDYSQMRVWVEPKPAPTPAPSPPKTAQAAELRRWDASSACKGDYAVLSTDKMNKCTSYVIPAPASIWIEQKNNTAYSSYHCQGVTDCGKALRKLLGDFIVGTCENFGKYSQMRVWISNTTLLV